MAKKSIKIRLGHRNPEDPDSLLQEVEVVFDGSCERVSVDITDELALVPAEKDLEAKVKEKVSEVLDEQDEELAAEELSEPSDDEISKNRVDEHRQNLASWLMFHAAKGWRFVVSVTPTVKSLMEMLGIKP